MGVDIQEDIARVEVIHRAAPTLALTLNANQGYTPDSEMLLDGVVFTVVLFDIEIPL